MCLRHVASVMNFSTRSVAMNLARPLEAGKSPTKSLRRVATFNPRQIQSSLRDENPGRRDPGVETPG
jgi:hypothetical protein